MKDDITSIPISEVFEPKDGCPVCRLRDMLEDRSVTYITGAAMMEPDVRIETNKAGFCRHHYGQMLGKGKKLTVALIMQSHLAQISADGTAKRKLGKNERLGESCFICNKLDRNMRQIVQNICVLWEKEKEFRNLYFDQPYICLNHCRMLITAADKMQKKNKTEFIKSTTALTEKQLEALAGDLKHFCDMFDYRKNGQDDWGSSKDSVERTVTFLTSESIDA